MKWGQVVHSVYMCVILSAYVLICMCVFFGYVMYVQVVEK